MKIRWSQEYSCRFCMAWAQETKNEFPHVLINMRETGYMKSSFCDCLIHLQGGLWKEALKILKLVVTRSSVLAVPPSHLHSRSWDHTTTGLVIKSGLYVETPLAIKKELPGALWFHDDLMLLGRIWCQAFLCREDNGFQLWCFSNSHHWKTIQGKGEWEEKRRGRNSHTKEISFPNSCW